MATRINGLLLGVVSSFAFMATSFAQDAGKIHNFSIAPEISSYEYKEPGLMKLSGTMYGVSAEYLNNGGVGRIKNSIPIQLRGRFNYMQGDLQYDGHVANIYTGERWSYKAEKKEKNYFFDTAFLGGVEFKLSEKLSVSPYSGFGYRYLLDDNSSESSKNPYPHKRKQTYYYMPIGADWKVPLASGWSLAFNTELDVLLRGKNTTNRYQTRYNPYSENSERNYRQKSGYGLRLSAKAEKNLQSVGVFAEPFFRYWDIAKSNTIRWEDGGYIYESHEPKNKTTEYGLRVGVSF
ncbi:MAG: hypothetical protein FWH56_04370 [Betaproteobacteria bacterium]|nr:hypothetical protein [Betaproteobacteria bacterium]